MSRLQHFEYVQPEDLEKVGMSKPAAKRLLDLIKRKRLKNKLTKFLPVGRFGTAKKLTSASAAVTGLGHTSAADPMAALTCLIQVGRHLPVVPLVLDFLDERDETDFSV